MQFIGRRVVLTLAFCALVAPPANAEWHEAKSEHFIVYSEDRPERLQAFAEKLERFDQAVRLLRDSPDPDLTDSGRVKIFVVDSDIEMERLTGNQWIRGLYRTNASGSFAFVPRRTGKTMVQGSTRGIDTARSSLTSQAIFFHEYAHHLQLQSWAGVMPAWTREGFAEFFATAEISDDGNVTIGKFPSYRSFDVFVGNSLPVDKLVSDTSSKLSGADVGALYGRGWLLTHYLTLSADRRGQLAAYLTGIERGMEPGVAARDAFGDLKTLARDVDAYAAPRKFLALTIKSEASPVQPVTVRPLKPGEAALMEVQMRYRIGVSDKDAPRLAADARKVAERFPSDPYVQATLADAEFRAQNYKDADAAPDRALAADSGNLRALITKGRAQMMFAKAAPAQADWQQVRSWFIKANKLDTEAAEPLMHFYRTYAEAGELVPQNAVDGLLYALDLAPQDSALRLMAVRQLTAQKRFDEARTLFAPLAFDPHADESIREKARAAYDSIVAGDSETAINLIDESQKEEDQAKARSR